MTHGALRVGAIAATLVFPAEMAIGATTPLSAQARQSTQVTWENDKWAFAGEDRSYTNGIRFEWRTAKPDNTVFGSLDWLANGLHGCDRWAFECSSGLAIGQNFYTPDSLHVVALQPADRPYAGFLYLGIVLSAARENILLWTELDLGVVGDLSMAESTQKGVHKIVGATHPRGWDHQLGFEVAGALRQKVRYRLVDGWIPWFGRNSRWFDLIPHAEGVLGTTFTHLEGGGQLRIGYNLTNTFLSNIAPVILNNAHLPTASVPGQAVPVPDVPQNRSIYNPSFEAYAFVSGEGRAAFRNLFLQGNTFKDSHSVDLRRSVTNGHAA